MNNYTRFFLVLLRLAIGWHFLVEGLEKVESVYRGPTETSRPWTSEGYLRESNGPLSPYFRELAGDLDAQTLARLTPVKEDAQPPRDRLPPALKQELESYIAQFTQHHALTGEQFKKVEVVFDGQQDRLGEWLVTGTKEIEKNYPSGTVKETLTTAQRVGLFRDRLQQIQAAERELKLFNEDVRKQRLTALKGEARRMRAELNADLHEQLARIKKELQDQLTSEQKQKGEVAEAAPRNWKLEWADWTTRWGLTIVGALLILGLFTRPACVVGAGFLLMFYLAMPPFPWLPENLRVEGHYLVINKNIIEMLALLTLATTRSGMWCGLDGVVQYLNPFRGCCAANPETKAS